MEKEAPEEEVIPDGLDKTLDTFHRLLLIRSFAPDRTISQAWKYVGDSQGEKYVDGVVLDLDKLLDESGPRSPMVCFLSMGSDPTNDIMHLAKRRGKGLLDLLNEKIQVAGANPILTPNFSNTIFGPEELLFGKWKDGKMHQLFYCFSFLKKKRSFEFLMRSC